MDYLALCSSNQPDLKISPHVVPEPSSRHGGLCRHGPVARGPYGPVPLPGRAGLLLNFKTSKKTQNTRCDLLTHARTSWDTRRRSNSQMSGRVREPIPDKLRRNFWRQGYDDEDRQDGDLVLARLATGALWRSSPRPPL